MIMSSHWEEPVGVLVGTLFLLVCVWMVASRSLIIHLLICVVLRFYWQQGIFYFLPSSMHFYFPSTGLIDHCILCFYPFTSLCLFFWFQSHQPVDGIWLGAGCLAWWKRWECKKRVTNNSFPLISSTTFLLFSAWRDLQKMGAFIVKHGEPIRHMELNWTLDLWGAINRKQTDRQTYTNIPQWSLASVPVLALFSLQIMKG